MACSNFSMPCPGRALSPPSVIRNDEKNTLKRLNDRLACYIERALYLKNENCRLKLEITGRGGDKSLCDQLGSIRDGFQRELDAVNAAVRKCAAESEELRSDICSLQCRLESAKKNRDNAEQGVRDLCEQLAREKCEQKCERDSLCKSLDQSAGSVRYELQIGYEAKSQKLLRDLRNQFQDRLCIVGLDIVRDILNGREDLRQNLNSNVDTDSLDLDASLELKLGQITKLQKDLADCTTEKEKMRLCVSRFQREHKKNCEKIRRMQLELVALLKQYQDLVDIKFLLDFELAAYNQLLAIEEYRLNVTDMCTNETALGSSTKRKADSQVDIEAKRGK